MMLTVVYLAALVLHCTVLLHAEANMYEAGISAQHRHTASHGHAHGISVMQHTVVIGPAQKGTGPFGPP